MRPIVITLLCLSMSLLFRPAIWADGPTVGANAVSRWTNPTTTARGKPLTNLAGINVWIGTSSKTYTRCYNAGLVSSLSISALNLADGQYYIAVQAYNTIGGVSELSNEFAFVLKTGQTSTIPGETPVRTEAPRVGPKGSCSEGSR